MTVVKRRRQKCQEKVEEHNNDGVFFKEKDTTDKLSAAEKTKLTLFSGVHTDKHSSVDHAKNVGNEGEADNDVKAKNEDCDGSIEKNDAREGKDAQAPSRVEMRSRADEEAGLSTVQLKPKEEAKLFPSRLGKIEGRCAELYSHPRCKMKIIFTLLTANSNKLMSGLHIPSKERQQYIKFGDR